MNIDNTEYRSLRIWEKMLCSDYYYDGRNLNVLPMHMIGAEVGPWNVGTIFRKTTAKESERMTATAVALLSSRPVPLREGDPVGDLIEATRTGRCISFRKHDPVAAAKALDDLWAEAKKHPEKPLHAGHPEQMRNQSGSNDDNGTNPVLAPSLTPVSDAFLAPKALTYDDGKAPLAHLPWAGIDAVAQVQAYGHKKYGDFYNYRKGMEVGRNLSCAIRHIRDYMNGQDNDAESGQSHLAHAACRLLFVMQNIADGKAIDDRYSKRITKEAA